MVAALDYARLTAPTGVPPRLRFLAHRAELLVQARRTFRYALQDAAFGELLVGGEVPTRWDHVFASIQSAGELLARFGPAYFTHVVLDECDHVLSASYQRLVPHLRPELLVALTATPERADGQSLLPDFDGHIAAELMRLVCRDEGLDQGTHGFVGAPRTGARRALARVRPCRHDPDAHRQLARAP